MTLIFIPDEVKLGRFYQKLTIETEIFRRQMKEISVKELKQMIDSGADFQLIDVREPNEFEVAQIGGELIPLATVPHNVEKFSKDKKVVVHCRSGKRSGNAIQYLEQQHGFDNLYNLQGGILAWSDEIDPSVVKY